jgi:acyl carrier protein
MWRGSPRSEAAFVAGVPDAGRSARLVVRALFGDMEAADVRQKLKEMMVAELNLEGKSPADIDDAAPLFGEGLGLDSLDALQLAMAVEEHFGVKIPEGPEARPIFASVDALVAHIVSDQRARASA